MQRRLICGLLLLSIATLAAGASIEEAEELYMRGDADGARRALTELLATESGSSRAEALMLLGRIEVDSGSWPAALEAWSELADNHADSPQAGLIQAALRPLQALAQGLGQGLGDCGCAGPDAAPGIVAAPPPPTSPSTDRTNEPPRQDLAPPAPTTESALSAAPGSAAGLLLVGGWSKSFEASQEATKAMVEFLDEAGVAVRFVPTDVVAVRGSEATLSYLLDQAEESGATGVLYFSARFTHRDYVLAERFDPRGTLLWKEKISGGTELRPSRERGQVRWALVERMQKSLDKRIGTPDLPTQ